MNLNAMSVEPSDPTIARPSAGQPDWLFLDARAARAALNALPDDAPVLLVRLGDLDSSRVMSGSDWEAAFTKSLLSRIQPAPMPEVLTGPAGLELQPAARLAFCDGAELQLTSTEFALLQELLTQDGAVVSVDGLSRAIWGHDTLGAPNYVEAHISRLRRKLREVGAGRVIETVRGAGYRVRQPRTMGAAMPAVQRDSPGAVPPSSIEVNTRHAA